MASCFAVLALNTEDCIAHNSAVRSNQRVKSFISRIKIRPRVTWPAGFDYHADARDVFFILLGAELQNLKLDKF